MRIILSLLLLMLTIGCATRTIKYDRNKISKKYSTDYNIYIDNQIVNFENIYLNKYNINYVQLDKRKKNVNIKQLKSVEFVEIKQLYLDRVHNLNGYSDEKKLELLIVVDGYPAKDSCKIDPESILALRILSSSEINNNLYGERSFDGGIIITTK